VQLWGLHDKGWGLCVVEPNLKEKIMRELSIEELEVVVGGMPIVIDL